MDIHKILHPTEYAFFPSIYETFTMINHILSHKTGFNNLKKFKSYKLCSLTTIKLKIIKISGKSSTTWKLKSTPVNNPWIKNKIKEEFKSVLNCIEI